MHYSEMLVGGGAPGSHDEPCDRPASVKHDGQWFCEFHYDALVDLDSHWQALLRVADQCEPYEFADIWLNTEDGGWVVFEGVEVEGMD